MEDEEDTYVPKVSWGDLSAIVVAGCFSLLCLGLILYMFLGGHPLAGVIDGVNGGGTTVPQSQEPTQAETPMNLAPGEVRVTVPPKAKKPPPKP
jgi:hypothetical protein